MSFMISRETENIESISEVVSAFRAITSGGDKPYVTKEEILQVHEFVVCCHGNIPQLLNSSVQAILMNLGGIKGSAAAL